MNPLNLRRHLSQQSPSLHSACSQHTSGVTAWVHFSHLDPQSHCSGPSTMPSPQREALRKRPLCPGLLNRQAPLCSQRNWWKKSELQLLKPLPLVMFSCMMRQKGLSLQMQAEWSWPIPVVSKLVDHECCKQEDIRGGKIPRLLQNHWSRHR